MSAGSGLMAATFGKALGVQLYTVRNEMPAKPRETLEAIRRIGFTEVEVLRPGLPAIAPILKELGLSAPSCHVEASLVTGSDFQQVIDSAKGFGLQFLVVPYLRKDERGGLDAYRKLADQLNQAGEQAAKAELTLCYHHHSFEFSPIDGKRPFDILAERFNPKTVQWEVDVFWVKAGGEDPAALLQKLKGRVSLVHLKDMAAGSATQFDEAAMARTAFKEVGNGSLNWPAILQACAQAGVKHYFVEQDQCPGSPLASIEQSYRFLRALNV
jgi:sugar phosphate isomerase/epimerase